MSWISVNDRLPEEDELVLVAVIGCDKKENITWEDAYLLARFYPEKGWYLEDHWEATDFRIRWWMRLPEDVPDGKTVRTNADRIRSMSDADLYELLCKTRKCDEPPTKCSDCPFKTSDGCGLLDWLRQPYKED